MTKVVSDWQSVQRQNQTFLRFQLPEGDSRIARQFTAGFLSLDIFRPLSASTQKGFQLQALGWELVVGGFSRVEQHTVGKCPNFSERGLPPSNSRRTASFLKAQFRTLLITENAYKNRFADYSRAPVLQQIVNC